MEFNTLKELMNYCHANDLAAEMRKGNTIDFSDGSKGIANFEA